MKQEESPLVSVYIVNHNYGKYLDQSITSVLNQTFKNFEIIFIDNGSKDNSKEKLERFYANKKIKIVLQENIGPNAANNVALRFARGKYIMRLDADDYLDKNALEIMSALLEKNKDIGMVFPDYFIVDENGDILNLMRRHDFSEVELFDQPAHGACSMVRREYLESIGGYDESYHCQDGWDLWVKLIKKYGVENINLPLFFYRQHSDNLSKNEKMLLSTRAKILKKNAQTTKKVESCLAVIPIRGTGLDKSSLALKKLGNKLVVDWTIDSALEAERISDVIVTTPDENLIKHIKKKYSRRIKIYKRDWKMAKFGVTLDKALTDLFNNLPKNSSHFQSVCILYIEYPFRDSKYIDMSLDTMDVFETERVISMRSMHNTLYKHSGKGMLPAQNSYFVKQEKDEFFAESGGIYLVKRGSMLRDSYQDKKIGHINVDEISGLDINSKFGWEMAKIISKKNNPKL